MSPEPTDSDGSRPTVSPITFLPLGATHDIGASCHYLEIAGTGVLLDAGVDPDEEGIAALPDLSPILRNSSRRVDHVLVTHAHNDHMGALPVIMKAFPHARVHMTPATRRLVDVLLPRVGEAAASQAA